MTTIATSWRYDRATSEQGTDRSSQRKCMFRVVWKAMRWPCHHFAARKQHQKTNRRNSNWWAHSQHRQPQSPATIKVLPSSPVFKLESSYSISHHKNSSTLLLLMRRNNLLHLLLTAHENPTPIMNPLGLDLQHPLHLAIHRHAARILHNHRHRRTLIQNPQLPFRRFLVRGVCEDAAVQERAVGVGDHGPDVARRVGFASFGGVF